MATGYMKNTNSIGDGDHADNLKKTEPIDDGIDWVLISKSKPNFLTRCVPFCSNSKRVKKLRREMIDTIEKLRVSKLYYKIRDQWENDCEFELNVGRVLGANSQMLMVINNLGSIESDYFSRYQLALAILLKSDFPKWISSVEASDADISPIDAKVMESFGCHVLSDDEEFHRQIDKPTLFYIPNAYVDYPGYLLEENWCPFCLNQMILLTDSFKGLLEFWSKLDDNPSDIEFRKENVDYLKAINQEHITVEFPMTPEYSDEGDTHPFNKISCHFFHLDPQLDMDSLLPGSITVSPDIYWVQFSGSYYRKKKSKSNLFRSCIQYCSTSDNTMEDETTRDEFRKLTGEMKTTIKVLKESKLYQEIQEKWKKDTDFQRNIGRVLGSNSNMLMVIYAIGSIESSYCSQFQLALAILLRDDFPFWISGIEVYDPVISSIDAEVMEDLGCNVLSDDEECKRWIEKPTLFYMPFALFEHIANLLETNWCPSCLNQMIILTSSFEDSMKFWEYLDVNPRDTTFWRLKPHHSKDYYLTRERFDYIEAIQKYTEEFAMTRDYKDYRNPLNEFSCHFFNLDQQLDMTSLSFSEGRETRLKNLSRLNRKNKLLWRWRSCFSLIDSCRRFKCTEASKGLAPMYSNGD